MADLLLEIGTEELPASAAYSAVEQLERAVPEMFAAERLTYAEARVLASPRRLSVNVRGLPERGEPRVIRKKGPAAPSAVASDGAWTKAAEGFVRAHHSTTDELVIEETDKGAYVFLITEEEGRSTAEALPGLLSRLVSCLRFKKSMRWGGGDERFSRPVRWLVGLLDGDVVPFEWGGIFSSDITYGHRYLSRGPITVTSPDEYERLLREGFVVVDHRARLELITRGAQEVSGPEGAVPVLDDEVLEEVVQLVEWPGVILGRFEEGFLRLPREVLVHAMQEHQRYFPVEKRDGSLLAGFVAVHNGDPANAETIRTGHQRVLAARLADAEFFFDEDLKRPLADRMGELENVVYQSELGSMAEKSARLASLVEAGARAVERDEGLVERCRRAARLCKCDLVTHMVIEFPALQGTMGAIYAELTGEDARVARAIGELYLPRRLGDALPETAEGVLLALAEKADNLAASFGLGHVPTGSEDPYALRRQVLGMLLILVEHGFELSIGGMVRQAAAELESGARGFDWTAGAEEAFGEFVRSRERVFFSERGCRYDLVDAALAVDWEVPVSTSRRLDALAAAREAGLLAGLYTAFERCHNLSRGHDSAEVDPDMLTERPEQELFRAVEAAAPAVEGALAGLDFTGALEALEPLRGPVDTLFDEVLVMTEDERVRENRLALLARVDALFNRVADFSLLRWD